MAIPVLGTAHLFGVVRPEQSERLLRAALDAGFVAFDTAPSYGHGRSEEAVGRAVRGHDVELTTKVGIAPSPAPGAALRLAKAAARHAPRAVQQRLRGHGDRRPTEQRPTEQRPAEQGRFGLPEVRESIDTSLRRLRRIDRLLLHEVRAHDLDDDLLGLLQHLLAAGDVGRVGVATSDPHTAECLHRAPELFTTANVSIAPDAHPIARTASLTQLVGHGVFGAGGAALHRVTHRLRRDARAAATWQDATVGTPWTGPTGLGDVFVLRALARVGPDAVIVATGRTERLPGMRKLITDARLLPDATAAAFDALCDEAEVSRPV